MPRTRALTRKAEPFDRYAAYQNAVQSPEDDADFLKNTYRSLRGRAPKVLREDFCGTFALCCHWAGRDRMNRAVGVDIDPEPIGYGTRHNLSKLPETARNRVETVQSDVTKKPLPSADIACALNFSYFTFKTREILGRYLANCHDSLAKGGLLVLDAFGGSGCEGPSIERTRYGNLTYLWEQKNFDPVTNHADFGIHFKLRGKAIRKNCFTYAWRMWTIPEIRELLREAGFRDSKVYWEQEDRKGRGNGVFLPVERGEPCSTWIVYIVGIK